MSEARIAMRDSRNEPVTVTLTAAEWDEIALYGDNNRQTAYAERMGGRYKVAEQMLEQVGPPGPRREAAREEAQAKLAPLTRGVRSRLARHVAELIRLREADGPIGDHLGRGDGWPKGLDGWGVTCIRLTDGGGPPNMHFTRRSVWFERSVLPMTEAEKHALVKMVSRHRTVVDVWGGGDWLSVTWRPR